SESQRMRAQDLPCVFDNLVKKYEGIEAARQLTFYFPYSTELANLRSLTVYSLCERHYNQLIVFNNLYNLLQGSTEERNRTYPDDNQNDVTDSDIVSLAAFSEAMNHLYISFISTQRPFTI
ncbi:18998_t:CDS:2, partial [Gigaspora margarita]